MKVKEILEICKPVWKENNDYNSEKKPMFSVLLPTFRRAKSGFFEKCVKSVLNQSFDDFELIIIDDASTDGTEEIINEYMRKDSRVKTIRHTYNVGLPAISEYEGYKRARGQYIAFIFDDCVWEIDYLQKVYEYINSTGAMVCVSRVRALYELKNKTYFELGTISSFSNNSLITHNFIANSGVVLNRSVIEDKRAGLYDPHIIQIRVCDWSLWKRIKRHYIIHVTNIFCGYELGVTQKDSLGNTYDNNHCSVIEREIEERNIDLSPAGFGEVEIDYSSIKSSKAYIESIIFAFEKFKQKKWYREDLIAAKRISADCNSLQRIRIGVVGNVKGMIGERFERFACQSEEYVFKYFGEVYDEKEILIVDAVIVVEDQIVNSGTIMELCQRYDIPCFCYLNEIIACDGDTEQLEKYEAVLTSTEYLSKQLIDKYSVDKENVETFPLVFDNAECMLNEYDDRFITLGFFGKSNKIDFFIDNILPEIRKFAKEKQVRLVCLHSRKYENVDVGNIQMVYLTESCDVQFSINEARQYNINILIHYDDEKNTIEYSTINELFISLYLGANLITNNNEISNSAPLSECVTTYKKVDELIDVLNDYIYDKDKAIQTYNDAVKYCDAIYCYDDAKKIFDKVMRGVSCVSSYSIYRRIMKYISEPKTNVIPQTDLFVRPIISDELNFAGKINGSRTYKVTCRRDNPTRIGICFAKCCEKEAKGELIIKIADENGTLLCFEKRSFDELLWNNWNYFSLDNTSHMINKILKVKITCSYVADSVGIGVFEVISKQKRDIILRGLKNTRPLGPMSLS